MLQKFEKSGLTVPKATRLDVALASAFPQFSRRQIRRWIHQGSVWVNQKRIRKQSFLLQPERSYSIRLWTYDAQPRLIFLEGIDWKSRILYRDNSFVAINKPAGANAYPTEYSVIDSLFYYLQHRRILPEGAHPFHRLDRPVSGVLIIPVNRQAARRFNAMQQQKMLQKIYLALVKGIPPQHQWTTEGYLSPPALSRTTRIFRTHPFPNARWSVTNFQVLWTDDIQNRALIAAIPVTGRTHQIRVHLSHSGHPILNDVRYGGMKISSSVADDFIFLHHYEIRFPHPFTHQPMSIQAPLPDYFQQMLPPDILKTMKISLDF